MSAKQIEIPNVKKHFSLCGCRINSFTPVKSEIFMILYITRGSRMYRIIISG